MILALWIAIAVLVIWNARLSVGLSEKENYGARLELSDALNGHPQWPSGTCSGGLRQEIKELQDLAKSDHSRIGTLECSMRPLKETVDALQVEVSLSNPPVDYISGRYLYVGSDRLGSRVASIAEHLGLTFKTLPSTPDVKGTPAKLVAVKAPTKKSAS